MRFLVCIALLASIGCGQVEAKSAATEPRTQVSRPELSVAEAISKLAKNVADLTVAVNSIRAYSDTAKKDREDLAAFDHCWEVCKETYPSNKFRSREDYKIIPGMEAWAEAEQHCQDKCQAMPRPPGGC